MGSERGRAGPVPEMLRGGKQASRISGELLTCRIQRGSSAALSIASGDPIGGKQRFVYVHGC